jgi:hypothetical protein
MIGIAKIQLNPPEDSFKIIHKLGVPINRFRNPIQMNQMNRPF